MGLQFRFKDAVDEARSFGQMAASFFPQPEKRKLDEYIRDLASFRDTPAAQTYRWQTREPIKTRVSKGEYELDNHGANIYGEFQSVWDLRKLPDGAAFELYDGASTFLKIVRDGDQKQIGFWNVDVVARAGAPGCHFHTQVKDWDFAIPRLPSIAVSPFAAFEFLLSELFQLEWARRSREQANGGIRWRQVQKERLKRLLKWADQQLDKGPESPWVAFKNATPDPRLFAQP